MWVTPDSYRALNPSDCGITFLDVSDKQTVGGWYYPLHTHEWFETVFCIKGAGQVTIHSTTVPFSKGQLMLIRPNTPHSFYCGTATEFRYCVLSFQLDRASETGERIEKCPGFMAELGDHIEIVRSCFQLLQELYATDACKDLPLFYSMCLQLLHLTEHALIHRPLEMPLPSSSVTDKILEYIHYHYREELTLERIAKNFNISVAHLSRLFRQTYNISLINYLIDYRFCIAKDFLSQTEMDIRLISELVGYHNVSHFSRLFLKRCGSTPKDYRNMTRASAGRATNITMDKILARYGRPEQ